MDENNQIPTPPVTPPENQTETVPTPPETPLVEVQEATPPPPPSLTHIYAEEKPASLTHIR